MKDKELRKLIGSRIKSRRLELNLGQQYIAEKMDVNKSTIQRYEAGTIDNSKKLILEGLAEILHVSVEWLKGETEEYETDITDQRDLQIRDAMRNILESFPLDMADTDADFSKGLLLAMLREYSAFNDSFKFACDNYKGNKTYKEVAKVAGFESTEEFNEILFLREVTHTINTFNEMSEIIRMYSKNPDVAKLKLQNLLEDNSESV